MKAVGTVANRYGLSLRTIYSLTGGGVGLTPLALQGFACRAGIACVLQSFEEKRGYSFLYGFSNFCKFRLVSSESLIV